jgi:predicted phage terminase large subunit-like protein
MSDYIEVTKKDIELEKLRRKKEKADDLQARFSPFVENGFWEFCKWYAPDFYNEKRPPLKRLCGILQDVTVGKYKKVLISVFRRFGKSRTCSMWIAWQIGYNPDSTFMRNCYSAPLAIDLSKKTMDIIESAKYKELFPGIKLDPRQSSKLAWQIDGSEITTYFGTGVDGSIIGKGCKTAALLDDPIKNPQEALSETFIDSLELFIESVHNTCIDPSSDCAQIIISTRWVENDPIGQRMNDPTWKQFIFPALDENDQSICEDIISTEMLIGMRTAWQNKGMGWMFESMYQCKPVSNLISRFNVEELRRFRFEDLPKTTPTEIVAFIDYANKGSDFLSMPIAYCWGSDRYIVDVVFSDEDSKKLRPLVMEKILKHKPENVTCETNQGGQEFAERLEDEAEDVFYNLGIELIHQYTRSNKEIRILIRTGEIKSTCLFLERDQQHEQYKLFFDQLTSFGKLKKGHDDAPDSLAGLLGILSESCEVDVEYFGRTKKSLDNNYQQEKHESVIKEDEDDDIMFF